MNKTELFINNLKPIETVEMSESVRLRLKLALLDYIGVTLAGISENREKVESLIGSFGGNEGVYPVGINRKMSINDAAFLNGLNGHALDFDDGTNAGIIHLGSPLFSVILAMAQKYEFSGEDLLRAVLIGYEAEYTMARTIQPTHKKKGFHATGTIGMLGIAMAVSYLLGFDEDKTKKAFSTAACSATGTLKVLENGSELKPYNVAKTALLGLHSVEMALAGFDVAEDALSGYAGFLTQFYGTDDVEFFPVMAEGTLAVEKAYIKPYAACRYTHPSIDIALELKKEQFHPVDDIKEVRIRTYSLAVNKHDHTEIPGANSAKMSIPYNFAVTYITGKTGMDAFTEECLFNEDVRALTKKVAVAADEAMSEAFPEKTEAAVEIELNDGTIIKGSSELPKGEPENPLSKEEAIAKFESLALYGGKTLEQAKEIEKAVFDIEKDLDKLAELLI